MTTCSTLYQQSSCIKGNHQCDWNAMLVQTIKPIKKIHIHVYGNNGYLVIEIEDNGIGISKSQMEKYGKSVIRPKQRLA